MDKKIELNLSSKLYTRLVEVCERENLMLEEYIIKTLEEKEYNLDRAIVSNQLIIKDLQGLIAKIQKSEKQYNQPKYEIIKIVSLNEWKSNIPDSLAFEIHSYRMIKWFNEKHFYLLFDKTSIVGYLGLDLLEEPMPYGQYGYIYCININKAYNNLLNYQKVLMFLQKVLKKEGIYNLDITLNNSFLTADQLLKLGFIEFYSINLSTIMVNQEIEYDKTIKYSSELIEFDLNEFQNLLTVNRRVPLNYTYDYWNKNSKELECKKIKFHYDNKLKEFFLINRTIQKDHRIKYSILIEPLDLFDMLLINQVYQILIMEMNLKKPSNTFIIEAPEEIEDLLQKYTKIISSRKNSWYRKVLS